MNIANAAVFGMKQELGLTGNEYNIALVVLFVRSLAYNLLCSPIRQASFHTFSSRSLEIFYSKSSDHMFGVSNIPSSANQILTGLTLVHIVSGSMFIFGVITIAQGTVKNYSGLLATRFLLGLFESSVFPGCFYLIAM